MNAVIPLLKQLFGAKYERIRKSLLTCGILFFSLYAAEIRIAVAPSVLYLTAALVSAGMMWQALHSAQNADVMMGLFLLPFDEKPLTYAISLAFSGYTLVTRTFPVLAVFFAVRSWRAGQIATSILCACTGCMMAASAFSMARRRKWPLALLWAVSILGSLCMAREIRTIALIAVLHFLLAAAYLFHVDAYVFYCPPSANPVRIHAEKSGSVFVYLLRYLRANTDYLLNTAGLCGIACFLPFLLEQFEMPGRLPMGFALLCFNTPICILLSCNPDFERSLRMLPGQLCFFCLPYCLFIFSFNTLADMIYLLSWQVNIGGIGAAEVITMLLFAGQGAIFSVLLEWRYPIRRWHVEADLWRHPRKYLVPALMLLIAGVISLWPAAVWIWLCILALECFLFLARLAMPVRSASPSR